MSFPLVYDIATLQTTENILNITNTESTIFPVTQFDEEEHNLEHDYTPFTEDVSIGSCIAFKRAEGQEEFLTRAYLLDRFDWKDTDNGRIRSYAFPQILAKIPPIANKLRYYTYLRTGYRFFFMVNATPFQYGLIKVRWMPAFDHNSVPQFGGTFNQYVSLQSISTMPGIDILGTNSRTYEFRVPYELNRAALSLKRIAEDPVPLHMNGYLDVWVVNPLRSMTPNSGNVSISMYAALDDPFLFLPCPDYLNFESLTVTIPPFLPDFIDVPTPKTFNYESGLFFIHESGKDAQKKSEKGTISSTLDTISKITPMLAAIPEVGEAAMAIGAAANTASQLAATFGYSKTVDLLPDNPYFVRYPSYANSRGMISCNKLTLDPANEKPDLGKEASGNKEEYLLHKITSIYTYLGRTAFSQGDVTTFARQIRVRLSPSVCRIEDHSVLGTTYKVAANTMCSYVSNVFSYYRGGMRVKFEFVYSQFHSQRFRICYVPARHTMPDGDPIAQANCLSKVITVNGYMSSEITIPFNHPNYCMNLNFSEDIGYIVLYPLSDLVCSQTSTAPVYINSYIATDSDAEFFVLKDPWTFSYNQRYPAFPASFQSESGELGPMADHMGDGGNFVFSNTSFHLGDNLSGESIRSVKDIIQRATPALLTATSAHQFTVATPYLKAFNDTYYSGVQKFPLFCYFALLYRFRSGGWLITYPRLDPQAIIYGMHIPTAGNQGNPSPFRSGTLKPEQNYAGINNLPGVNTAPLSFKAPYYYDRPFTYNNIQTVNEDLSYIDSAPPSVRVALILAGTLESYFISAADDFHFYKLFAPPTLFLTAI